MKSVSLDSMPIVTTQKRHLLNASTGAEADIRVDVALHFTVVEAVCLWQHRENEH